VSAGCGFSYWGLGIGDPLSVIGYRQAAVPLPLLIIAAAPPSTPLLIVAAAPPSLLHNSHFDY
jgi:hypothetical protein